jgi:MFS family permease
LRGRYGHRARRRLSYGAGEGERVSSVTTVASATPSATLDRPAYKHYVLLVLSIGYVFNVADRGVYGVVLESIKQEIRASDFLMGLLGGLAFSVCHSFATIPIARLADRWSRVKVLSIAVGVWSLATASCGLAWSYMSLLFGRAFTAIGEAGGTPPSHALISDYFPASKRATALAVFAMAVPIGAAVGNYGSGWFNEWYGWRMTFVLLGLPGIFIALLIWFTVKEPPRGYADGRVAAGRAPAPPFFAVCRFLLARNSFVHMSVGAALHAVVWYSGTTFNAAFFQRSHDLSPGETGTYIAIFSLIGALGSFAGGYFADRLSTRNGNRRWYMWVPAGACLLMVPVQFLAYLSPDLTVIVPIAFSLMFVLASMFFGPSFAVAQSLATARMRSVAASVLLFIQTLIGLTLGPAIVGLMSDGLQATYGPHSLAYAMALIGVVNIWAAAHYFLAARRYPEDLEATARLDGAT